MKRQNVLILLAVIIATGAALRLIGLGTTPPGLHFDEAVYGLLAQDIYRGARPVFFSAYTGREPLYMYIMALVFRFVGINALGIRLTSALIGIVTLPLAYLLFRELFTRRVGLLTVALTALSYWHLTVSRNGYPNILIPPLECLALYFLWRGYRDNRKALMALGGIFVGGVLYTYLAARLFPVTVALFFIYTLLADRKRFLSRFWGLTLAALVALLVFAPLGYYFLTHPHDFWERADQVLAVRKAGGAESLRLYATNALQTLGGFFLRGDPRQHYNLPGKPIFDALVAPFFALGLVIAIRNWRKPEYALLPIWTAGMSLPALLTADLMPQGQRMFGVIPAIFGLAALGLDAAFRWARRRLEGKSKLRYLPALVLALILAFEGAMTTRTYFAIWGRQTATYYIFNTDYYRMAREVQQRIAAGETVVIQSYHYKHPTVVFATPQALDAVWTAGGQTFVVPERPGGVVYFRPADVKLHPALAQIQEQVTEPQDEILDPEGDVAVAITRLRPEVQAEERATEAAATFSDEIAVLDWETPESLRRDEILSVMVHWRALRSVDEGRNLTLHLVDENGVLWSQGGSMGYLSEQWRAGDTVYQRFDVPLPAGIPAGRYEPRLILAREAGAQIPVLQEGDLTGTSLQLGTVDLLPEGRNIQPQATGEQTFGDTLQILAHDPLNAQVPPGGQVQTSVSWQALREPDADHRARLTLRDSAGQVAVQHEGDLAYQYPTSLWQANEMVRATYVLKLGTVESGTYTLELTVAGVEGSLTLGEVKVTGEDRIFDPPLIEHPITAQFGDAIELLGYDLFNEAQDRPDVETYRAGETLSLRLYWRAHSQIEGDYKVFVHIIGNRGQIWAQDDAVPAQWQRPTTGWVEGEIVMDEHIIALPPEMPPERYTIFIGMYDPATLDRLTVRDETGEALPLERLPLTTLVVE
ncbi:MAG: ArnT family glycosyltransferase [Anaerolineae bacterium]